MDTEKVIFKRNELYEKIWAKPMTHVAQEYDLSDNGLRKICKKLGIPYPALGYWAKLQHGKKVSQTPLPPQQNYPESYELHRSLHKVQKNTPSECPEHQALIDFEMLEENRIIVPNEVTRFHPLVKQTRDYLKKQKPSYMGTLQSGLDCLDINVSPSSLERALRIANSLITALDSRGITLKSSQEKRHTHLIVLGEEMRFKISEKINQRKLSSAEIEAIKRKDRYYWGNGKEYTPSGNLCLKVYEERSVDPRKELSDGKMNPLEDKLNIFIRSLYNIAEKIKREKAEREIRAQQWELERERQRELERQAKLDLFKTNLLIKTTEYWNTSNNIRAFIEELRKSLPANEELINWIEWANQKAQQLDPISNDFLRIWNSEIDKESAKLPYY